MHKLFLIGLVLCFVGLAMMFCDSPGVEKVNDADVYRLQDDYYIKRIIVNTNVIYIRCDINGNLLSGPISTRYGKNGQTTAIGE